MKKTILALLTGVAAICGHLVFQALSQQTSTALAQSSGGGTCNPANNGTAQNAGQ